MVGEAAALASAHDASFMLKPELLALLSAEAPPLMLTDSKGLLDALIRSRHAAERRLMIDIAAVRQAYSKRLIKSGHNLADGLTKVSSSGALLQIYRLS